MKKPIYIIDDDDDVRDVLSFALESEGHKVKAFPSAKLALDQLLCLAPSDYPGMILVDYMMPEMDGITFINEWRRLRPQSHQTSLALNSANGKIEHVSAVPEGVMVLTKPMDLDDLLNVVNREVGQINYSHP